MHTQTSVITSSKENIKLKLITYAEEPA